MDFFTFPLIELTVAQFSSLCFIYFLLAGLTIAFMEQIVSFICKFIKRLFKHDKN